MTARLTSSKRPRKSSRQRMTSAKTCATSSGQGGGSGTRGVPVMSNLLAVPKASEDPVEHADWLELRAIEAADRSASLTDLSREIARAGTTDATRLAPGQTGREKAIEVATAAIN